VSSKRNGDERSRQSSGEGEEQDLKRLSKVAEDHVSAASDQAASDADQTASDADQALSDTEGELAATEQVASDLDQSASDRDQAASAEELREHPGQEESHRDHRAERAEGTRERTEGTRVRREAGRIRTHTADERRQLAEQRDESAWHRDRTAQERDSAADRRDKDSAKIERKMGSRGSALRVALTHAAEVRAQAAKDRARAAEDRAQAAADRLLAAEERAASLEELRQAHRDDLTGAFRRGPGEEAVQDEIDRARREGIDLVLAFLDVDSLREVNNVLGHPSGDALLQDVVSAVRSKIRSYEPIVRFGGDEFICVVGGVDLQQAQERFMEVREWLAQGNEGRAISFGLAKLEQDDTLADLIARADAAMLETRGGREGS
jgi:diguanylate cyclase (GGDEF)-like protein